MSDHTPAPWEWVEYEYGFSVLWNPDTKEEIVDVSGVNEGDYPLVWMGEQLNDADRLLMQASPDMFEALGNICVKIAQIDVLDPDVADRLDVLLVDEYKAGQAALKLAKEGRKNE